MENNAIKINENVIFKGELITAEELTCRQITNCTNNKCSLKMGDEIPDLFFHISDTNEYGKCGLIIYCRSVKYTIDDRT